MQTDPLGSFCHFSRRSVRHMFRQYCHIGAVIYGRSQLNNSLTKTDPLHTNMPYLQSHCLNAIGYPRQIVLVEHLGSRLSYIQISPLVCYASSHTLRWWDSLLVVLMDRSLDISSFAVRYFQADRRHQKWKNGPLFLIEFLPTNRRRINRSLDTSVLV